MQTLHELRQQASCCRLKAAEEFRGLTALIVLLAARELSGDHDFALASQRAAAAAA